MAFFDKKQDVIDIKLTQFGKNLLARGFFKPVYYRFFDDGVLYNPDSAGIEETQKRSEERIEEAQRPRTQYLVTGVETRFDQNENLINSGTIDTFMEIKRRQDPMLADKILKYPLENSAVNSPKAPSFSINVLDSVITTSADSLVVEGISLPIPQLTITSSYELIEDRRKQIEVPDDVYEFQSYVDLLSSKIEFLDKSFLETKEENIVIDIEELNVDSLVENFEIEIYEVDEKGNLIRLESEEEIKRYFDIKVDEEVDERAPSEERNDRFNRDRN